MKAYKRFGTIVEKLNTPENIKHVTNRYHNMVNNTRNFNNCKVVSTKTVNGEKSTFHVNGQLAREVFLYNERTVTRLAYIDYNIKD